MPSDLPSRHTCLCMHGHAFAHHYRLATILFPPPKLKSCMKPWQSTKVASCLGKGCSQTVMPCQLNVQFVYCYLNATKLEKPKSQLKNEFSAALHCLLRLSPTMLSLPTSSSIQTTICWHLKVDLTWSFLFTSTPVLKRKATSSRRPSQMAHVSPSDTSSTG